MKRALFFLSAAVLSGGFLLSAPGPVAAALRLRPALHRQMPVNPTMKPATPARNTSRSLPTNPAITMPKTNPLTNPFQLATPNQGIRPLRHHRDHFPGSLYPPVGYYPTTAYSPSTYSAPYANPYMMGYGYSSGYGSGSGYGRASLSSGNYGSTASASRDLNYTPADAGMLRISVPDVYARVTVNDRPISSVGSIRYYVTPTLQAGQSRSYTVRAVWKRDGRTISIDQKVYAEGGQTTEVDFVSANLK